MTEDIWWYITRSGGIVALGLAGATVIWGLLLTTKIMEGRPGPKWLLDLHKWLGGSTVVFTLIHVIALLIHSAQSSFANFGLLDVLVPYVSNEYPHAVALGIIAAWMLITVQVTSLFMQRLPRRVWRAIHLFSYAMLWTGVIHGALVGTDKGNPIYIGGISLMVLGTVFLTGYRILTVRRRHPTPAVAA